MSNQVSPIQAISYKDYIFKVRLNKVAFWFALFAVIVQFCVFKYMYPFANYIHGDSFSYIRAASNNVDINTYVIGYSKFLRLFSVFSKSDLLLTCLQYVMIQASALFMLSTIFYLYRPTKLFQAVLFGFMILNPLFLHLGNLVSSDGHFLALSITWFTLLIWIINRPLNHVIIWHALILFLAFSTRYNAFMYPFVSIIALLLSKATLRKKIIGIGLSVLLCAGFILFTSYNYKKLTGKWQYSPFSGWQLSNNAMYAYRYIDSAKRKSVPKKFVVLDRMIRQYYDSTRNTAKFTSERIMASTYYMWSFGMPLMKYRDSVFFRRDTTVKEFRKWATMGPYYKEYGIMIIKKYPWAFVKYFIWPNANKYYAPPLEFLEAYNSGNNYVMPEAVTWFKYTSQQVKTRMNTNDVIVLKFYPILSGIINVAMLASLLCYVILKGWQNDYSFGKLVFLGCIVWLGNAAFTIFASSAALRFQSFPIILSTVCSALLINWMIKITTTNPSDAKIKMRNGREAIANECNKEINKQLQ